MSKEENGIYPRVLLKIGYLSGHFTVLLALMIVEIEKKTELTFILLNIPICRLHCPNDCCPLRK